METTKKSTATTEIINIILNFAKSDENIRAVLLEGSRANSNGKVDEWSDYDIAFVTCSNEPYLNKKWFYNFAEKFGRVAILQEPDNSNLFEDTHNPKQHYAYLTLFDNGLRMDITFETVDFINTITLDNDSAIIVLLDKDNIFPNFKPSDREFWTSKPTENQFKACCNEFCWCLQNVAKGIVRNELPYAMRMYNICHDELDKVIEWYIGNQNNFKIDTGKFGRYFKNYLPENLYEMYEETYPDSNYENLWNSIFTMCELFRILAKDITENLGFEYIQSEDDAITKYLTKLREKSMYKLKMISNEKLPFLQYIENGKKKAEGRIATDFIKSFKIGELLKLESSTGHVICEITYLNFYKSFEEMLTSEGLKNMVPFANTFEEALKIYESFPGAERVKELGCCAIGVKHK